MPPNRLASQDAESCAPSAPSAREPPDGPLLTVVIPVYNEAPTVDALLRRVLAAPYDKQVIVVDDGSTDGTGDILARWADSPGIEVFTHPSNRGKGTAIRTALQAARGRFTLIQDADLEYDPADYPRLVEPLLAGQADVVYGSRRLGGQSRRWSVLGLGVSLLNVCVRLLYGVRITDEATCYKAFHTAALRAMDLRCERFEFCPEVTAKSCRMGLRIVEVPIRYHGRTTREGKKLRWHDGIEALRTLWRWRGWEPPQAACDAGSGAKAPVPTKATSRATGIPQRRGESCPASSRAVKCVLAILLAINAGLLAYGGWRDCMTWDEIGHLPAGISHWQRGEFSLYRVNPPLVRMVATIPVVLAGAKTHWGPRPTGIGARPEFYPVGTEFVRMNGARSFWLLTLARWMCIPFSLLGAYLCFRWASDLHGGAAGLVAAALWCFCPNILAHGRLITPDVGGAALGLAAAYAFWRWLKSPNWPGAVAAGALLGCAELAKTTWITLFVLWPMLWLAWNVRRPKQSAGGSRLREVAQLAAIVAAGLVSINVGYGFEGSFRRLGDFRFCSRALAGGGPDWRGNLYGNRFAGTWLASVPVPLPENYVHGIDAQKWDFDRRQWSYLRGEWRRGGWWYYYLYALTVKVPLGTLALLAMAAVATVVSRAYRLPWRDEMMLLVPLIGVLALVSSQTGFNHHLRYVLPIFPFAFILASRVAVALARRDMPLLVAPALAIVWSVASSLAVYPYSLSYFNELAGGPVNGHQHLHNSNVDWGQDLFELKHWVDKHPESRALAFAPFVPPGLFDPRILGIECETVPPGPHASGAEGPVPADGLGPRPGWYALSVNRIHNRTGENEYFLR